MRPRVIAFYQLSRRMWLVLISFLTALLLVASVAYVQASSRLRPLFEVKTEKPVLALTFDISWGTRTPVQVLDILKEHEVRATFFLSGPWVEKNPQIPRRIAADGHEIGSHGYRHINLSQLSFEEIKEEIQKAHASIEKVTGCTPRLIRTPNGDYDNKVIQAAQECGYQVIQWGTDSLDWKNPGTEAIIQRVLTRCHPGDIILMHASDTCQQTPDALPAIIRGLKEKGYQLVTVSELLSLGKGQ